MMMAASASNRLRFSLQSAPDAVTASDCPNGGIVRDKRKVPMLPQHQHALQATMPVVVDSQVLAPVASLPTGKFPVVTEAAEESQNRTEVFQPWQGDWRPRWLSVSLGNLLLGPCKLRRHRQKLWPTTNVTMEMPGTERAV